MADRVGHIAAGYRYCYVAALNSDNFIIGASASAPAAGDQDGSGMLRLEGASTAPVALADSEIITAIGDDEPLTTFDFGPNELPSGIIEMVARNREFEALAQGTLIQTLGEAKLGILQGRGTTLQDLAFLFQRRAKKWQPGNRGSSAWELLFVPIATAKPLFSEFQTRQITNYRYGVSTSFGDRSPIGATLKTSVNGTESAPVLPIDSDNPMYIDNYIGDSSETVFNLSFAPVTTAKVAVGVNGAIQTGGGTDYTINVANKTITFTVAPPTDAVINVWYEVDENDLV